MKDEYEELKALLGDDLPRETLKEPTQEEMNAYFDEYPIFYSVPKERLMERIICTK